MSKLKLISFPDALFIEENSTTVMVLRQIMMKSRLFPSTKTTTTDVTAHYLDTSHHLLFLEKALDVMSFILDYRNDKNTEYHKQPAGKYIRNQATGSK